MTDSRLGLVRTLIAVAGLLLVACGTPAEGQEDPTAPIVAQNAPTTLPGVDLTPLSPEQRELAMKIFHENGCGCGCGMNIVDCRIKDPTCGRSPRLAAQVISLLAQGKPEDEVVKAVFSAPTAPAAPAAPAPSAAGAAAAKPGQEYVFAVNAGDSFGVGPESAPVTLITWLDYQ